MVWKPTYSEYNQDYDEHNAHLKMNILSEIVEDILLLKRELNKVLKIYSVIFIVYVLEI